MRSLSLTLLAASLCLGQPPARQFLAGPLNEPLSVARDHPRLVFRPDGQRGRTFAEVRRLYRSDKTFRDIFEQALKLGTRDQNPAMLASCWVVTGEDRYAEAAIAALLERPISRSGDGGYSNIWSFALAYDWLYGHAALTPEKRATAEKRIRERLLSELAGLDETGMALWHGRNQAANNAMVGALAIADLPEGEAALRRAAGHYAGALRALDFSEGWPEGASYWIYNRAAPYAVAADCVMTALGTDKIGGIAIRDAMRKIGLWSIYQYTPAEFFEPYGDSAGSLRLGETGWWEVTADYFARLSRDPRVMAGADYLRNRSPVPYGKRPYQWYAAISYDPSVRPAKDYDPARPELWMRKNMPQAMLFGRQSIGVAFLRGDWGDPDELYATFKAGDMLAHHDHYDAGHFGIQFGGLLAPQTGLYGPGGGYYGRHRLGYAIQTVSSNSILVMAPGETSRDLRARKEPAWTALSGGQRVIRSIGFDCLGLEHFQHMRNNGPHLERADITAYESAPGEYDYLAADITAAYNSTRWAEPGTTAKVSLVTRQFLYLRGERAFLVYDRVETPSPAFLPKFLLHALSKPETANEKLLAGNSASDGILETSERRVVTRHRRAILTSVTLLPEEARLLKIGGPNHYAYVEQDGDQSNGFDGVNLEAGDPLREYPTAQPGLWRTEVEPLRPDGRARFLHALLPRLEGDKRPLPRVEVFPAGAGTHAARVGDTVAIFAREPGPLDEITVELERDVRCLVLDAHPGQTYRARRIQAKAGAEGVLALRLPKGRHVIRRAGATTR